MHEVAQRFYNARIIFDGDSLSTLRSVFVLSSFGIEKIRILVILILLALFAGLLGQAFWSAMSPSTHSLTLPTLNNAPSSEVRIENTRPVYLFGTKATNIEKPVAKQQSEFKQSKLNLKLMGILMAPNMSVAIINKSGQANSYVLDEEIQRGVVLKEVHEDYVVLSNRGLLEKLEMTKPDNLFAASDSSQELNQTQMAKLSKVKENALKNPVSIMRYVRFQNKVKNGKIDSVKVWPRQEKEIFTALGFVAGDELLSVDGQKIDKLAKSPQLWQRLLKQSQFELIINRNGQQMPLSVELQ